MGLPIVKNTDFIAEYQISTDKYSKDKLDWYINQYEKLFLDQLLGCELAALFIADLDASGVPQTQRFIDIYEPFCKQDDCGNLYESLGIKTMLTGLIYYKYVSNNNSYVATTGNRSKLGENSDKAGTLTHDLHKRHNVSVFTTNAIQWFIEDDMTTYPEYEGIALKLNHWAL